MKTALVYDRVNKWGGAERVLLALHSLFPNAPLFTSVFDEKNAQWAKVFNIKTSFLQKFPHIISNHELYPFLMPIAFEQFNFDDFDLVISVTSEAAKGIITKPGTRHICYCLTPTRYLWTGYNDYFKSDLFRFISYPAVSYLRTWDKIVARRPDLCIAISEVVKKRIKQYYGQESEVVYPPLYMKYSHLGGGRLQRSGSHDSSQVGDSQKSNYFLVVSRLISYKRIDIAINACNELQIPLKIIGAGKEEQNLRKIAGPTIEFLGNVTDEKLEYFYRQAKALICPGIEDFGLTIIESQKYKTPVIAFRGGGALETIKEGKTGIFFKKQNKGSLIQKIQEFDKYNFMPVDFEKQIEEFSFKNFKSNFLSLVEKAF